MIHGGHIRIIREAATYGRLIAGILTDEVVASYRQYPLVSFEERKALIAGIKGVAEVVPQDELSYRKAIETYHPDIVVHGDDWLTGFQRKLRDEVEALFEEDMKGRLSEDDENIELEYRDGHLYYAIVQLTDSKKGLHRYICYQCRQTMGGNGITLVYMEGKASLADLRKTFKKK